VVWFSTEIWYGFQPVYTEKYLAYQCIVDSNSRFFLLECYTGFVTIDLVTGEVVHQINNTEKNLYNADIHTESNTVYIPTERRSLLAYSFNEFRFYDVKTEKTGGTAWVKISNDQSHILVSDGRNSLHCFELGFFYKPIWSIDFSIFKPDYRIRYNKIITTDSNLGCIQGFTPSSNQHLFSGGTLYIFNIKNGEIVDKFNYSKINEELITDINNDQILMDNMKIFSLSTKSIENSPVYDLLLK